MYITQLLCPFAGLLTPGIDTRPRQAEASAMLVSLSWKGRSMIRWSHRQLFHGDFCIPLQPPKQLPFLDFWWYVCSHCHAPPFYRGLVWIAWKSGRSVMRDISAWYFMLEYVRVASWSSWINRSQLNDFLDSRLKPCWRQQTTTP